MIIKARRETPKRVGRAQTKRDRRYFMVFVRFEKASPLLPFLQDLAVESREGRRGLRGLLKTSHTVSEL